MINDFVKGFIDLFLNFYNTYLHPHISTLISYMNEWQNHTTLFNDLLSGVYYICGKSLVIYIISVFAVIITIRIVMALVNIIGQFIP